MSKSSKAVTADWMCALFDEFMNYNFSHFKTTLAKVDSYFYSHKITVWVHDKDGRRVVKESNLLGHMMLLKTMYSAFVCGNVNQKVFCLSNCLLNGECIRFTKVLNTKKSIIGWSSALQSYYENAKNHARTLHPLLQWSTADKKMIMHEDLFHCAGCCDFFRTIYDSKALVGAYTKLANELQKYQSQLWNEICVNFYTHKYDDVKQTNDQFAGYPHSLYEMIDEWKTIMKL